MTFISLSQKVTSKWFHRLFQVVSLLLITLGIGTFIYGLICISEVNNKEFALPKAKAETGFSNQSIIKDPDLVFMDKLLAEAKAALPESGVNNQHILEFERDRAFHFMAIGFIPWIVLWLSYRAVLFVCMGTKAFVCSSS